MKRSVILTYLAVAFTSINALAQQPAKIYFPSNDIGLTAGSKQKMSAWSGGVNNPQPCLADLNNDKKKDLVIYEQGMGVQTFINVGTSGNPVYKYDPTYEGSFPTINYFLKMDDYNRDGVPDIIHRGMYGFSIYRGYYKSNQLFFSLYKELYYSLPGSGWVNVYSQPGGIPGAIDVDGDGDLDLFSYDVTGGLVIYYRNCQVEDKLPADSVTICLKDNCWGKVFQNESRKQQLGITCNTAGQTCNKTTKTTDGVNTLCMYDFDGDGDVDYFNGNTAFSDIQYFINGRKDFNAAVDTMKAEDTIWSSNGHKMITPSFPAAFAMDIDQDGKTDLVFSPHNKNTENYNSLVFYKNTGTNAAPNFTWQTDAYMMDETIDFGINSHPAYYDYDKDGKPDLFVGSDGLYQSGGTLKSRLAFYLNTSTTTDMAMKENTLNFLNLDTANLKGISPAFGDLDNDGKDDMVIGLTDGTILLFSNTAASNTVQPVWTTYIKLIDANNAGIDVGYNATPFIYDMNKDGKPDLLIGNQAGNAYYYENNGGTTGKTNLKQITGSLGGIKISAPGFIYGFSSFYAGRIDDSAKDYLLVGSVNGILYRYSFNPSNLATTFVRDSAYSAINVWGHSHPAVADMNGDGKFEMMMGNELGGVKLFRQLYSNHIDDKVFDNTKLQVYPNPANNLLNLAWDASFANGDVHISLVSVTGQKLMSQIVTSGTNAQLDVQALATGVYYCVVQSGSNRAVQPVTIIR